MHAVFRQKRLIRLRDRASWYEPLLVTICNMHQILRYQRVAVTHIPMFRNWGCRPKSIFVCPVFITLFPVSSREQLHGMHCSFHNNVPRKLKGTTPLSLLGTVLWKLQCMPWSLSLELPGNIVLKTAVHARESFPWGSWEHCYENCSACHGVCPFELPGNIVMKTAVHARESFPWGSWEHCYENCSACHGVFPFEYPGNFVMKTAVYPMESYPLNLLGTLLWKLQCMSWSLSLWTSWEHCYENCSSCHGVFPFELPGNIVFKTAVHIMESFPWASWEHCYENYSAWHGVFPLNFLRTLLWKLQCMSWSLSLELPGNVVMKTAVHVIESFPRASWEHYENCSACHGVFPFSFLGTLLWKLRCMPWRLSLELPGNIVMKTAVHIMESFPWASWEHCYENYSAWHGVFPFNFLRTLLWKLQCMSWSLSLELPGNVVMKTAVHVIESFPWGSWEHYENCSACHGVFPLSFLGTLIRKMRCMPWRLSLELPGNVVMKTAVHVIESFPWASWEHCYETAVHAMESFPWASWEHCYENCSACHGVFPLSFLRTMLWKLQCLP